MTSIIPKLHRANNVFTDRVLRERYDDNGQTAGGSGAEQPLYRDTPDCDCFDKNTFDESENINTQDTMASGRTLGRTESSPEVADLMKQPFRVFGITFAPLSIPFQRRLQVRVRNRVTPQVYYYSIC